MTPHFTLKRELQQTIKPFVDEEKIHTQTQTLSRGGGSAVLKTIKKTNMYNQNLKIDELLEKQFKNYNIQYFK